MSEWCVPLPARDLGFWESYPISPAWCLDSRERRLWESLPSIQHPPLRQPTATETGPVLPQQSTGRAVGRRHHAPLLLAH